MKQIIFTFLFVSSLMSSETVLQKDIESPFSTENIISVNDLVFTNESFSSTSFTNSEISPPAPILQTTYKNALIAASLSSLIPGLGHVYLDDMKMAGALMGSAALGYAAVLSTVNNETWLLPSAIYCTTNLYYGVFSAYRDARIFNGMSSYSYRMPTEQLAALVYAPFQPSVLKKPEVWGGILGAMALASATVYFAYSGKDNIKIAASTSSALPLLSLPIAIGEETFFRGFLQSTLSESCTPFGGLVLSSLAFGAAHIPNALVLERDQRWRYYSFSLPFITGLGAYLGWLTQKNHSLKESVALHMWYDFIIFSTEVIASKYSKASMGPSHFSMAFSF